MSANAHDGIAPHPDPETSSFDCTICEVSIDTLRESLEHEESVTHIMRSAKLLGLPVAKCVLCRSFALLPLHEHIASPKHIEMVAKFPLYAGPALQVVVFPQGLHTLQQHAQLQFNGRYEEVYRAQIVAHLELFGAFYRAEREAAAANADPMALADWPPSPELSDDSVDDGSQFLTPP